SIPQVQGKRRLCPTESQRGIVHRKKSQLGSTEAHQNRANFTHAMLLSNDTAYSPTSKAVLNFTRGDNRDKPAGRHSVVSFSPATTAAAASAVALDCEAQPGPDQRLLETTRMVQ